MSRRHKVAVIGAGPAGIFCADALEKAGREVVLLNRDLKPGGLLEYGVFPTKHKFKNGLRKQFRRILSSPHVHYRGGVSVGERDGELRLDDVRALGFDAIVVAVGAQGTKRLGLPGEDADGVYHAKDLVYHYNKLPPFASRRYPVGDKIVIVGVGNVMIDVVHWLDKFTEAKEAVAVARAVPRFRKYSPKEVKEVKGSLDVEGTHAEIERIRPLLQAAGESADADLESLLKYTEGRAHPPGRLKWRVRWLVSPLAVALDADGRCCGLEVQPLRPIQVEGGGRPKVEPLGEPRIIPADNVVFAIGDSVDGMFGLPVGWSGFETCASLFPDDPAAPYKILDEANRGPMEGVFSTGWAREASVGLVGQARKDAFTAARHVADYLDGGGAGDEGADPLNALDAAIAAAGMSAVDYEAVVRLEAAEASRADGDPFEGKLESDDAMRAVMAPPPR